MDIFSDKPDLEPNQAVCFNCKKILTSKNQYDMVVCSCGAIAVDGGYHLRIIELKETLPAMAAYHLRMKLHLR